MHGLPLCNLTLAVRKLCVCGTVRDAFVVGHIGKTMVSRKNHQFLFSVFARS